MKDAKSRAREIIGLVGLCLSAGIAHGADAIPPSATAAADEVQEVVVTGYRKSLDGIHGRQARCDRLHRPGQRRGYRQIPDTNIAESFNRIPGITISRDITARAQISRSAASARTSPRSC